MFVIYEKGQTGKPIKVWLDDKGSVEAKCLVQAKNLSNLPFLFSHVALMPDTHMGYGMPIGGVIATEGAIIANAVGVDIGCFTADTKVPLLDGTMRSMKSLSKEKHPFWIYSIDKQNKIVPGRATCRKTRRNARLIEITISGGETIACTPDHQFLLRDGTYKIAADLRPMKDRLMSFYRSYQGKEGYEYIYHPGGKTELTHKMVARYIHGKAPENHVAHHDNLVFLDNRPENIYYIHKKTHSKLHRMINPGVFGTKEFIKKRFLTLSEKGFYDPKYAPMKRETAIRNITTYMSKHPDHFRESVKGNGKRGRKFLVAYNKSEKGRAKSREVSGRIHACQACGMEIRGYAALNSHMKSKHNNHVVLSVRNICRKEDVYCLNVPKYHNFALAAGVFVHNCGMAYVDTGLHAESLRPLLPEIVAEIMNRVPTGFSHHEKAQEVACLSEVDPKEPHVARNKILAPELQRGLYQKGTLGGGNHFIEVQEDAQGNVGIMIHSGSRNFGKRTCDHFNGIAVEMNERWHAYPAHKQDLAFLPTDEQAGKDYIWWMNLALAFAQENRAAILSAAKDAVGRVAASHGAGIAEFSGEVNAHHNYAALEHHFGRNVWVHRKGAIRARKGEIGIVPGAMGSYSYIVAGTGNEQSFSSCSHGAGRKMSRSEAKKQFAAETVADELRGAGVIVGKEKMEDVAEECAAAYKDIDFVIAQEADLCVPVKRLKTIAVVKG